MSKQVQRRQYTELFGPTTGDAVRLGDTDLFAVVEHDKTVYGDESVFGGGKVKELLPTSVLKTLLLFESIS